MEYGFFSMKTDPKMIDALLENVNRVSISLRKLEDAWREKWASDSAKPDITKKQKKDLVDKLKVVSTHMADAKEHLACIVIQIIALYYDNLFVDNYEKFYKSTNIRNNEDGEHELDIDKEKLDSIIENQFVFADSNFYNKILHVVMNYLSEYSKLGDFNISTPSSKKAIEKAFMFVTTIERDCCLTSIKSITETDLAFFD